MKKIRVLSEDIHIIGGLTVNPPKEFPVWNEEMLEWPDVKEMLQAHKIEIIEEKSA